jgi:formyl transferase-like protein
MGRMKVAALISEEPGPQELWTLRAIASADCEPQVLRVAEEALSPPLRPVIRRSIAGALVSRLAAEERSQLEELFDFDDLRAWRETSAIVPAEARTLNRTEAEAALAALAPDLIVRVSGAMPKSRICSLARIAALNIHHGQAPRIRGTWSIPWAIIEGRRDWIGAAVHIIGEGIETGPILWRGSPQLAPGDTHVDLLFRAHLEAAKALTLILNAYARGEPPSSCALAPGETSAYRPSAGLGEWLKLLYLGRGRRARMLLERGIEC